MVPALADDSNFADIIFEVEGKPVYANRFALSLASREFREMFTTRNKPIVQLAPMTNRIRMEGISYKAFLLFIRFIYLSVPCAPKLWYFVETDDYQTLCELYYLSDCYGIGKLKSEITRDIGMETNCSFAY